MSNIEAKIIAIIPETPTVKRFLLQPLEPFQYLSGQWLDLYLTLEGKSCVGGYSMTSNPDGPTVELAIKAGHQHPVTLAMHTQVKVGDTVSICGGQGACVYQAKMGGPVVLLAGGIGITPLMSILRTMTLTEPAVPVHLIYSSSTPDEFAFAYDIKALCQRYPHVTAEFRLTQPHADWPGAKGRIDQTSLQATNPTGKTLYYLCGPKQMITDLRALLTELGASPDRIRFERW